MAYRKNKVFDISTNKGLKNAEKYQQKLYKKYDNVRIYIAGLNKVEIYGV